VIAEYLNRLAGALSFDPSLARRVRDELADHLLEKVAADPGGDRRAAEERALAACGDPRALAAEFALLALTRPTRRLAVGLPVGIAAVFLVMEARVAWYAAMQWTLCDELKAVARFVLSLDAYAFLAAVAIGVGGCVHFGWRRLFSHPHPRPLRGFCRVSAMATGALVVSIASDGVLTALRLRGVGMSPATVVPLLSMAAEIAPAIVLIATIRTLARRAASTAALRDM
jgi:hypothetical protein